MESSDLHYPIIGAEIRRELYTLLALLYADEKITGMAGQNLPLAFLSDDVLRLVLPLRFLTVAAAVRGVLESAAADGFGDGGNCGLIRRDVKSKDEKRLSLREACSRAIHADRTIFYPEDEPAKGIAVFNGNITLYGRHGKKRWKAVIDMEAFAAACLAVLQSVP